MSLVSEADPITYLVKRRYPLYGLPPMSIHYSGQLRPPYNHEEAQAYRAELQQKSESEIESLVVEGRRADAEEIMRKLAAAEERRFFHQPHARADFDHYCKCSYWTADEAVALSFGRSPEIVNWKSVAPLVSVSSFARQYSLRRDLVVRAVYSQQLFERMYPSIFLSWARQVGISVDADLANRAVASGISLKGWRELYEGLATQRKEEQKELTRLYAKLADAQKHIAALEQRISDAGAHLEQAAADKPMGTRERENLQLIGFLGAVRGYGYDPDRKTDAAARIEADTDRLGMRFTDDRIRHHLREGYERVPPDWRERLALKPSSEKA